MLCCFSLDIYPAVLCCFSTQIIILKFLAPMSFLEIAHRIYLLALNNEGAGDLEACPLQEYGAIHGRICTFVGGDDGSCNLMRVHLFARGTRGNY